MKDGKSIVMFMAVFFFFAGFPIRPVLFSSVCVTHAGAWIPEDRAFYFLLICGYLKSALNPFFLQSGTEALKLYIQGYTQLSFIKVTPKQ